MPFQVKKLPNGKYGLKYLDHPNKYTKSTFNSKQAALNAGQRYMNYRHEPNKVVGNKILSSRVNTRLTGGKHKKKPIHKGLDQIRNILRMYKYPEKDLKKIFK